MNKWYGLTADGSTIPLEKECECIIHDEPHWIHMDRLKHELNKKYYDKPTTLNLKALAILEASRLKEKEYHFKRLNIIEIEEHPLNEQRL
ncbi:hypothetical protein LCGC14_0548910 [marine sediment metagenome]|uniref:Uncharacterized protein n=1 Tax=marine sediment metagenome TaxID=412755 RepID=A0A0F9UC44_9ZZZZ